MILKPWRTAVYSTATEQSFVSYRACFLERERFVKLHFDIASRYEWSCRKKIMTLYHKSPRPVIGRSDSMLSCCVEL